MHTHIYYIAFVGKQYANQNENYFYGTYLLIWIHIVVLICFLDPLWVLSYVIEISIGSMLHYSMANGHPWVGSKLLTMS
jgi:hypothetical protein